MRRSRLTPHPMAAAGAFAAASLACLLFTGVPARADVQVHIDIGNAPPPPRVVFVAPPHERRYQGDPIYVVDDPRVGDRDCFHYQGYYWVFQDGYWYRSAGWRGPFVVCNPHYVPAVFYREPRGRWKHHPSGPPVFVNRGRGGTLGLMERSADRLQPAPSHGERDGGSPAHDNKSDKDHDKKGNKGHDKHGDHGDHGDH